MLKDYIASDWLVLVVNLMLIFKPTSTAISWLVLLTTVLHVVYSDWLLAVLVKVLSRIRLLLPLATHALLASFNLLLLADVVFITDVDDIIASVLLEELGPILF